MIASKMSVLKPLIESKNSQHFTAYLKNDRDVRHLKMQLREVLESAYEYLAPVMNPEALTRFVAPLHNVIDDTKLLKNLKGNVGIFRNESSFRILSLPVSVEPTCVVATSFHVKPLLRWIQMDREFLILGMNDVSASLYQGNQSTLTLVDTIIFSVGAKNLLRHSPYKELQAKRKSQCEYGEMMEWLNEWLFNLPKNANPQLFVAGQNELTSAFIKKYPYPHLRQISVSPSFNSDKTLNICAEVRSILKHEAKRNLEQALLEFYEAEDINLANKNIFQIAKAAIKGKVRKLIIADGINIFGKLDRKSGGLAIHPTHLDHEDDDILDDLAQEVLAHGGEVFVASRDEIPKGRPILAILERTDPDLTRRHSISSGQECKHIRSAV